eukprot:5457654-Amphidinium_carterae.1
MDRANKSALMTCNVAGCAMHASTVHRKVHGILALMAEHRAHAGQWEAFVCHTSYLAACALTHIKCHHTNCKLQCGFVN